MATKIGQSVWNFLDERFLLSQLIAFGKKKMFKACPFLEGEEDE